MMAKRDPDVEVSKVYFPQEGNIQIHQSRIKSCPPGFPSGYYWYGTSRKSAWRPPKSQSLTSKSVPNDNSKKSRNDPPKHGSAKKNDPPNDGNMKKTQSDPPKDGNARESKGAGCPRKQYVMRSSVKEVNSTETVPSARDELELERSVM